MEPANHVTQPVPAAMMHQPARPAHLTNSSINTKFVFQHVEEDTSETPTYWLANHATALADPATDLPQMLVSHVPLDSSTTTELVSKAAQEDHTPTEPTVQYVNLNAPLVQTQPAVTHVSVDT